MARTDGRNNTSGWMIGIVAVVAALLLFGLFTDGFGFFGTEMAPGTTTPPDSPN